ncbi:DUF1775 domain-containing protein [Kitasatospora cineracea]|uniref:Uncharacterized protein DUF1775 n=1 Tax=Kitasatospora cineracea TaxID=88074 RepID=A0A8G1XEH7_9ACTN|nr:DUF1775 domain-containing protein [Kitasatospora cineracea]ROR45336.1 uncharacterized protein DUF1775 [Kitasatospora cineracea]
MRRRLRHRSAAPLLALGLVLGAAGTAAAHVEVESPTAQALAVDAEVAFSAEGESSTAGITDVKVVLPAGLTPADLTLAKAPAGWTLAPTADGFTVAGPALAPGTAADWTVRVRQLPDAASLVFKTLVDYSDGHTDRWIELPQGDTKPQHPAPVLALAPAAPGAIALPTSDVTLFAYTSSPPASPSASASAPAVVAGGGEDGGSTTAVVLGSVAGVAVLAALVVLVLRRRRSAS